MTQLEVNQPLTDITMKSTIKHLTCFVIAATVLFTLLILSGCAAAYKGDVYLYSPTGAGNIVEKLSSTEADLNVPLVP